MIGFLLKILKDVDTSDWEEYVLAYDNMYIILPQLLYGLVYVFYRCNVDRLEMLRSPLPLEEPFEDVWLRVTKIIGMVLLDSSNF